ncbi:MAG: hypothetical protein ACI841_000179 [Planctomycetota bacterium]|jgi:hypothetical protein
MKSPRALLAFLLLLATLLAGVAYHGIFGLTLLGWDAYPMIASAKVSNVADFVGIFTEELMDGRYPDGHFYRPITNLTLAFDHMLWGLAPNGYHASDVLILIANAVLLGLIGRKLYTRQITQGVGVGGEVGGRIAAIVALVIFVLHPIQLELLPVTPRRADALCLTFTLLAICITRHRATPARQVLVGLFAFAAAGSKETGAIVAPLLTAWLVLQRSQDQPAAWRCVAVSATPAWIGVAVFVLLRSSVLGGLGGHEESSLSGLAGSFGLIEPYVIRVFYPQPFAGIDQAARIAVLGVAASVVISAALLAWRHDAARKPSTQQAVSSGRHTSAKQATQPLAGDAGYVPVRTDGSSSMHSFAWLACWTLLLLAISSLSGRVHDWYAMMFAAPAALCIGGATELAVIAFRRGDKWLAPSAALAPAAAALSLLLNSPLNPISTLGRDERWPLASTLTESFLSRATERIDEHPDGGDLLLNRWVPVLAPPEGARGIRSAAVLAPYSVDAFLELTRPERVIEVVAGTAQLPTPLNGATHLRLTTAP